MISNEPNAAVMLLLWIVDVDDAAEQYCTYFKQFLRRVQYDLSGYSCRVLSHIGQQSATIEDPSHGTMTSVPCDYNTSKGVG